MERLFVAKSYRLHEKHDGTKWWVKSVGDPSGIPSGIYRLDQAKPADPQSPGAYQGQILHTDAKHVYQDHPTGLIRHARSTFSTVPNVGEHATIQYQQGRAHLAHRDPQQHARGFSR